MNKYINKVFFWLNCARAYSLPITILNWLVIFVYSLKNDGNFILGILALIGISFVHLATNLLDDYLDYKILSKDEKYINSAQNCKCKFLKDNLATLSETKIVIAIFLLLAALIGGVLFFTSGFYVAILAFLGLCVAFSYQKFSISGLGEIAVIIAFGPLLYEGVYYVMTSEFSLEVLILSLACAFVTNSILYTHMLMDFDGDECSHKTTLCRKFKTKEKALKFLTIFYVTGFALLIPLAFENPFMLLPFLTVPLIVDLYNSLKLFNKDKTILPNVKFWHYPLDNWGNTKNTKDAPFYFRFFYSRNIVTYFMLLLCLGFLLE